MFLRALTRGLNNMGTVLLLGDYSVIFKYLVVTIRSVSGIQWVDTRDAAKHSPMLRTTPPQQRITSIFSSDKEQKLCTTVTPVPGTVPNITQSRLSVNVCG